MWRTLAGLAIMSYLWRTCRNYDTNGSSSQGASSPLHGSLKTHDPRTWLKDLVRPPSPGPQDESPVGRVHGDFLDGLVLEEGLEGAEPEQVFEQRSRHGFALLLSRLQDAERGRTVVGEGQSVQTSAA